MGGIVSNNSTGAHSILYGMTADHVLSMSVLLSDGSSAEFGPVTVRELMQYQTRTGLEADIYRQMALLTFNEKNRDIIRAGTPRHWRRCGGYNLDRFVEGLGVFFQVPHDKQFNLAKLVCGAEGTLAVMQEIKLNLVPLPTSKGVGNVQFNSLQDALNAVPTMLEVAPTAIELVDNLGLTLCAKVPEYARLLATFSRWRAELHIDNGVFMAKIRPNSMPKSKTTHTHAATRCTVHRYDQSVGQTLAGQCLESAQSRPSAC